MLEDLAAVMISIWARARYLAPGNSRVKDIIECERERDGKAGQGWTDVVCYFGINNVCRVWSLGPKRDPTLFLLLFHHLTIHPSPPITMSSAPSFSEKAGLPDLIPTPSLLEPQPKSSSYLDAIAPLTNTWNRYSAWRESFGLPNPGSTEQLTKEVKGELVVDSLLRGRDAEPMPRRNVGNQLHI